MINTRSAYDLVYLALREIGIASLGDTVAADISQEALLVLNTIRAEWSISSKSYRVFDQTYFPTTNMTNITLGTNGAIVGNIPTRPHDISQITIIYGGINQLIDILPYSEYRTISVPNIYSIPEAAYIDNQYPIQNVYLFPGIASGYGIRVIGTEYFSEYEHVSDPYIDPPEYFSALYLTLALRLAPKYGVEVQQGTIIQANSAMKHIKTKLTLAQLKPMDIDNGGGFSMWTGRGR